MSRYPLVAHSLSSAKSPQDPAQFHPQLTVGEARGFPRRGFCRRTRRKEFPSGPREPRVVVPVI